MQVVRFFFFFVQSLLINEHVSLNDLPRRGGARENIFMHELLFSFQFFFFFLARFQLRNIFNELRLLSKGDDLSRVLVSWKKAT